ncbi:hypothetical protein [Streptomyces spirodelae]|uniref:MFS transporter n=1 Tax=Streptomyces spirodelae TaxID=2812904 RepID=A0ABS3WLT9_9ACTN|nr:hypothetical protein [Streptomyces spirodelae]MBO8184076.1 hypothetical protein [Streptomyces spirodelae]
MVRDSRWTHGVGGAAGERRAVTAIPYIFVAAGPYVVPRLADRSGSRYPWIAGMAVAVVVTFGIKHLIERGPVVGPAPAAPDAVR